MDPEIYSTCPFCKESALVSTEPVYGLPDTVYEVICKTCGQFCILTRLLPENLEDKHPLAKVKESNLARDRVYNLNKSALSEGKMMIWVDAEEDTLKWDEAIEEVSDNIPQITSYAVKDLTDYIEES